MIITFEEDAKILKLKWSPNTNMMNDQDFKDALVVFAGFVEPYGANGLLVDVQEFKFMKAMEPELTAWRIKNISTRYNKAGVEISCVCLRSRRSWVRIPPGPLKIIRFYKDMHFVPNIFLSNSQLKLNHKICGNALHQFFELIPFSGDLQLDTCSVDHQSYLFPLVPEN